ncbi:FdtA/QdtA family cupin domain-containing protein [Seleniivibrio woodruffii]|uniref:sugar 3,4-ketoisomerase n=1 Tax=Seleniivibrio woodruffii TaxID=1078050 RepID=UPI0026EE6C3E|nr:FdtA/QdtA family cupin domain-containing protein [Seleniivibrio woodruffii]
MNGYSLIDLRIIGDENGSLIALEENGNVPFDIKRVYYIFNTKVGVRRGFHAHLKLRQLLICTSGSCTVLLDDGRKKVDVKLDSPSKGLIIEGLLWREMYDFSPDCVLMVLADEHYREEDYIRNYDSFMDEVQKNGI